MSFCSVQRFDAMLICRRALVKGLRVVLVSESSDGQHLVWFFFFLLVQQNRLAVFVSMCPTSHKYVSCEAAQILKHACRAIWVLNHIVYGHTPDQHKIVNLKITRGNTRKAVIKPLIVMNLARMV